MIYFIQAGVGGPIKIGRSDYPEARVAGLQTTSPAKLKLLRKLSEHFAGERALHQKFANHRLHGEWFAPAPKLLAYIKRPVPCRRPTVARAYLLRRERIEPDVRVQSLVSGFGGIAKLSALLGNKHTTTVRGWLKTGRIPHFRLMQLRSIAEENGVALPKWFPAP